jgi:hypothetical protein
MERMIEVDGLLIVQSPRPEQVSDLWVQPLGSFNPEEQRILARERERRRQR